METKAKCEKKILKMLHKVICIERMNEYLTMLSRFPQMNYDNIFLLLAQLPNATAVCGKGAWRRYQAEVMEGQKPIALFGPVYEEEERDNIISYDIVAVYDISQTRTSDETPNFSVTKNLERSIEEVIKDVFKISILDDEWKEVLPNKIMKSQYMEEKKAIYLKPGITTVIRETELLKQYARLCVNRHSITDFSDAMDHFVMIVLSKYFGINRVDDRMHYYDLFHASEEEKINFLQKLSGIVFESVCEISGKKLLSFNETVFCNLLFTTDDLSDAISKIGVAADMADIKTMHNELCMFLERVHSMNLETYQYIRQKKKEKTLFTFPPTNVTR